MLFREEISVDPETGARKGVKPARFDLIPVIPLYMLALVYGSEELTEGMKSFEEKRKPDFRRFRR